MLPPRRFQPALTLGYQFDLLALAEDARHQSPFATRESLQRAIGVAEAKRASLLSAGVPAIDLRPTVAYLAALRVLRDLLDQGWTLDRDRDGVLLASPLGAAGAADDPAAAKGALRASFSFARAAQLATPSITRFVRDMERRGVSRLVADGPELAARLRSAAAGERSLAEAVSPVLELVDQETRDATTGLRLMDVWRYMRLHWSIPYGMLVHLPDGYKPEQVRDALAAKIQALPEILRASLTWDQGPEMRDWKQVSVAADIDIYFCDPHAPWQRATNENTNGLLRQYFPKGSDLAVHSAVDLDWVATELNDRPRKRLGFAKPIEEIGPLLLQ